MNSKFGVSLKKVTFLLLVFLVLSFLSVLPISVSQEEPESGNITFEPNMIPQLTLTPRTGRNNESFRFEWLNNTFDLELFFNATYNNETRLFSLRDFEADFNVTVDYQVNRNESNVQFGWVIDNVEDANYFVDSAWFKIEDSSFDYEEIEIEIDEMISELTFEFYNITRFKLPDNLVLSFEDLYFKGFVVGWQNKTSTNVKGFTGKSSWDLDPISFSSPTITITGFTEGTPCTFWDVWNASNVNGWNAVNKTSSSENRQFDFGARLQIGDGSTTSWFADENVQVTFNSTAVSGNSQDLINVRTNGHFRLGKAETVADKTTSSGVSIIANDSRTSSRMITGEDSSNADVELYSSQFYAPESTAEHLIYKLKNNAPIWHVYMDNVGLLSSSVDVFDLVATQQYLGGFSFGITGTIDEVYIMECFDALYFFGATGGTYSNMIIRDSSDRMVRALSITSNVNLLNVDSDAWTFRWLGSSTVGVYRQYEFDLNVTDSANSPIQNANVTVSHYGQGETQDFSILTGSNGSFATQTLSMGFYNQTGGNSQYSYNPFNITITASGYATKSFNFTLDEKTDWQVTLETPTTPSVSTTTYMLQGILLFSPIMLAIALSRRNKAKR